MAPIRVLLVDDSPRFLALLARQLQGHPALDVVGTATTGQEGIDQAGSLCPDLVLLDLMMPGMNGLEVLPVIKALPHTPRVVMVTFQDDQEIQLEAEGLGADGFVTKAELVKRLRLVVDDLFPPQAKP